MIHLITILGWFERLCMEYNDDFLNADETRSYLNGYVLRIV
jgi:hypothetical protein